jgi:acetyl esterase/lipase
MDAPSRFRALVFVFLFSSLTAEAQVPADVRRKLPAIGFGSSLEPSMEIYEPLLAAAPKGDLVIEKDVRYGEQERNLVDIYRPRGVERAPVLVYVHGGGYRTGDRDLNALVYANVPTYFARHGLLAMSATYRLAPQATWPSGAEVVERAKHSDPEELAGELLSNIGRSEPPKIGFREARRRDTSTRPPSACASLVMSTEKSLLEL